MYNFDVHIYNKRQKLCERKASWFSRIFDESWKFSLYERFEQRQHFRLQLKQNRESFPCIWIKSSNTVKLFSRLTVVVYGSYIIVKESITIGIIIMVSYFRIFTLW